MPRYVYRVCMHTCYYTNTIIAIQIMKWCTDQQVLLANFPFRYDPRLVCNSCLTAASASSQYMVPYSYASAEVRHPKLPLV